MTNESTSTEVKAKNSLTEKDNVNLGVICHLLGIFSILGPLVIWLVKKDESPMVDRHGKEALNFQISIFFYMMISWILTFVLIGFLLVPLVAAFNLIFIVIAAVKTSNGKEFKYPFTLRLLK